MRFVIIGSGGCVSLPRPLCFCEVCVQARRLGPPYARCGCSLYCEELALLIDTPEDIAHALNNASVRLVERVFYSHWDPDHTMGMRIFEQMRLDWLAHSVGEVMSPVDVCATSAVWRDLEGIRSPFGPFLGYYQSMNLISRVEVAEPMTINGVRVSFVPMEKEQGVTIFLFEKDGKKLIYAPCDVKPFPNSEQFDGADVLIVGNTMVGDALKGGFIPKEDNPLKRELFSLEEIVGLKERHRIARVVITHLEEDWGKSYDDYLALERQLDGIQFAFDGMAVEI